MKIAIDARSLEGDKTGVGRYLENLLRVWRKRKDVEFIIYFKDLVPDVSGADKNYFESDNFTLKRLDNPFGFSSNFFFQHFLLPYNLKKDGADFFFSPFYLRPFFCGIKSAIVLHDISYEAHPEWFDKKSQLVLRALSKISAYKADLIFTVSSYSKSEIVKYYKIAPEKIVVTTLAVDSGFGKGADEKGIDEIKNKFGLSRFVLNLGTIFTRRRVSEIIDGFEEFLKGDKSFQLLIVGKNATFPFVDVDRKIEGINKRFKGDRIVRVDFVSEGDLINLYGGCEAVIYLSDYEGFGLPVIEAQSFGKPVITSYNSSLVEVGGDSVEFAKENEPECISQSFNRVLGSKEYQEELIAKGGDNIKRFNWQKAADDTLSAILRKI
ncbi:MAG: glycosyltransferase family 1 protein [Candidatus Pacebacteria bacterium]|nr:glycosyltransferase family 1 protein [Candidatus Paceibacterota bacterium]